MASQEDLVLKQYAGLRNQLKAQQNTAGQQLEQGLNRQQAITGLQGGAQIKARAGAEQQLSQANQLATSDLESKQAAALQGIAAQKQAQEYGTSERLGSQQFQTGQQQAGFGQQTAERLGSQQFAQGQTQQAQQFATGERQASETYQSGEAVLGRQFTANQQTAVQDFQNAQRLGAQNFQDAEAALGRTFTTDERQAIQAYQTSQTQQAQQFATGERVGTQQFASRERTGTEQFQAGQATQQQQLQSQEFLQNLGFQQNSFAASLAFQNKEFDQNVSTNAFNAAIAAFQAGGAFTEPGWQSRLKGALNNFGITGNPGSPVNLTATDTSSNSNSSQANISQGNFGLVPRGDPYQITAQAIQWAVQNPGKTATYDTEPTGAGDKNTKKYFSALPNGNVILTDQTGIQRAVYTPQQLQQMLNQGQG